MSFKGIEPLQIVQDIVKDIVNVNDIQKKNTQKGRKKFSKNKNLNNLITDIGGMVENMMKDGKIQDLVEDIKNDLDVIKELENTELNFKVLRNYKEILD